VVREAFEILERTARKVGLGVNERKAKCTEVTRRPGNNETNRPECV
jgi:hypothetical protein